MEKQVVSRKRVTEHGEVYTAAREVNAMLDLVKQETQRIDSRFLEPACGTGNFLAEILRRKLKIAESRYRKSVLEYERNAIIAVSSIYGIDILMDNVIECRKRLQDIFNEYYISLFNAECQRTVKFILECNIIWGDALDLKTPGDNPVPLVFSEWSAVNGSMIKRRDFKFEHLVNSAPFEEPCLFSDLGDKVFIPTPVKEFPLTHYLRLADAQQQ